MRGRRPVRAFFAIPAWAVGCALFACEPPPAGRGADAVDMVLECSVAGVAVGVSECRTTQAVIPRIDADGWTCRCEKPKHPPMICVAFTP